MATRRLKGGSDSAVTRAAQALRAYAMSKGDGEFLGSEDDLINRLGVSRPTLRHASAQVLQENLIAIRRGVGGGYFAKLPNSFTVSRIMALYLQSHKAGLEDIVHAMKPIRMEIARLAARNRDAALLDALRAFVEKEAQPPSEGDDDHGYRAFLRSEREFGKALGLLSGNSVLNLFLSILYDFAASLRREEDVLLNRPERVLAYRKSRAAMARAIIDGDDEIALITASRCSDLTVEWMREDLTGRHFTEANLERERPDAAGSWVGHGG